MTANTETPARNSHGVDESLAKHGHVSYLEIPAVDAEKSASFFEAVFGWNISRRAPGDCRFDDRSGALIGKWVSCREAVSGSGMIPYIYVDNIDAAAGRIVAQGGEMLKPPYAEGNLWVATFRDPAGNLMGIWQAGPR